MRHGQCAMLTLPLRVGPGMSQNRAIILGLWETMNFPELFGRLHPNNLHDGIKHVREMSNRITNCAQILLTGIALLVGPKLEINPMITSNFLTDRKKSISESDSNWILSL